MMKSTLVLQAFLGLTLLSCSGTRNKGPDIRIVDLKGLDAALAEHRGQGVLLDFWAIWCEPCVAELPELLETGREYGGRGGAVLTVSYDLMLPGVTRDEVLQKMRAFVADHRIDVPVLIYDASDYDAINERFGLPGPIPVTLAIDRKGVIADIQEGKGGKARFAAMMQKALQN